MDGHWTEGFEHASVTTENRESFNTAMSKYDTPEAAIVGGFNAQKLAGKPRLPKSMDEFADDTARGEFASQARTLLGINIPKDVESLKDLNFKAGLADDATVDENFVGMVKDWAVEQGVDTATLEKIAPFYNGPLTEYAKQAYDKHQEKAKLDAAEACNKGLIEYYKSAEEVQKQSQLFKQAIQNSFKLSPEEIEEVANAFADSALTKNPIMARCILQAFAPLAAEGSTHSGSGIPGGDNGPKQPSPYEAKKARFPKSESQWGDPSDKWEDQTIGAKQALGYKDPNAQ